MISNRMIDVRPANATGYRIRVGKATLSSVGETARELKGGGKAVVISDENVGPRYGKAVAGQLEASGFETYDLLVPPGEQSKSVELATELWDALVGYGFGREDLVVAVGGGVVGDLAGFVASTYMRGIDFIQVPTSLLAMVDASIGGKTAVDLPCGKNLVGTFHQPIHVCADVDCLHTLGEEDWANGFAEIVKSAVVAPRRSFFEWVRNNREYLAAHDDARLEEVIYTTADFKASVVSADATEAGLRECLNYGHTLAHAIEAASGYGPIGHGRAVAEGMRFAARLAVEVLDADPAFVGRLDDLLDALGLPELAWTSDAQTLLRLMHGDKKARGGQVRFVLARDFTDWEVVPVPDGTLLEHLEAWCTYKGRLVDAR